MNDYLLSVVLGIIEGLTEFLPVSSTAHLRIAEALFHLSLSDGYWKMYTIVIQLGAILCLPVYFRDRITKFLSTFPQGEKWRPQYADPSPGPHHDCLCRDRDSLISPDQDYRQDISKVCTSWDCRYWSGES